MKTAIGLSCLLAGAMACTAGPPVYFPQDERRWEVPMDAPLASKQVVVPVHVHGKGPYLFVLAPDATTTIDRSVADDLGLFTPARSWTSFIDTRDREVRLREYEILEMRVGQLRLRNFKAYGAKAGTLEVAGRKVHGVLGRNVLSRTVVVDIDRDRGRVVLGLDRAPPAGAVRLRGLRRRLRKIVVPARVEGRTVELAVDLAVPHSGMRFDTFELTPGQQFRESVRWTDEFGTHVTSRVSKRARCLLGPIGSQSLAFATHPDRRLFYRDYEGVLGQDFLARYRVVYDADGRELWLSPRVADLGAHVADRLSRWGATFAGCRASLCSAVDYSQASGELSIRAAPELEGKYDVFLEGLGEDGRSIHGALLRVTLDPSVGERELVPAELSPLFDRAKSFRVVDLSPIESGCSTGCLEPSSWNGSDSGWKTPTLPLRLAHGASALYLAHGRR